MLNSGVRAGGFSSALAGSAGAAAGAVGAGFSATFFSNRLLGLFSRKSQRKRHRENYGVTNLILAILVNKRIIGKDIVFEIGQRLSRGGNP
jgi:hypothetical protein